MSALTGILAAAAALVSVGGGAAAMQVADPASAPAPGAVGLIRPMPGAVVTQGFGCTAFAREPADTRCAQGHFHSGLDLAAPLGTTVLAATGGVAHVIDDATGYGLHVTVDDGSGLSTLYGHLSHVLVVDGESVAAGSPVGEEGSTGNSTGPHLHFEVRRDGIAEDPAPDLAPP